VWFGPERSMSSGTAPRRRQQVYGSLQCVVLDADATQMPDRLLLLCHGYGAGGEDLVPLGQELLRRYADTVGNTRVVLPAAPLELPGGFGGRAWWHLEAGRIYEAVARGAFDEVMDRVPDGMSSARRKLQATLDLALRDANLTYSQVVIAGFSQGSMLACDLTLRLEEAPAALALFSSALVARPQWERFASRRKGLRVLQTHGTSDMVLPAVVGQRLRDLLTQAGLQVDFQAFPGGHTIPPSAIAALADLLG
jgi:phospholipase/carboxylesterase